MQSGVGIQAAAPATAPVASDEEEDLRSNSNSSTASVVSSSSSLQLAQQLHGAPGQATRSSATRKKMKRDELCDACKAKAAVWFCPADDAYLCHACDRSVHSANAFSLRHERVSLQVVNPVTLSSAAASIQEGEEGQEEEMEEEGKDLWGSCGKSKRQRRNIVSSSPVCKNNRMMKPLDGETSSPGPSRSKNCKNREEDREGEVNQLEEEEKEEEEERGEELTHTMPVFVDSQLTIGDDDQQHSGIATDLVDFEEEHDESDDAGDIDRFLNDDHALSGGEEARQEQHKKNSRNKKRKNEHDSSAAPAGATCHDLNGLLGLRRNSLEELGDGNDDERFDNAIRKDQAIRAIPEFGAMAMDGSDGERGFQPGNVKAEQEQAQGQYYHHNVDDEFFPKPCRDTILGDILGLKLDAASGGYDRDLRQMHAQHLQRRICLRLDYEDVLNAWSDRRPFLADSSSMAAAAGRLLEDSISDAAGSSDVGVVPDLSSAGSRRSGRPSAIEQAGRVPVVAMDGPNAGTLGEEATAATGAPGSGGREARVSRYREKRRTRLFSKKIRYEVRKLNAERRPRLKGRFVKRSPV